MAARPLFAEVALPVSVALDRTFDYLLPKRLQDNARPGLRVRVPFRNKTNFVGCPPGPDLATSSHPI